MKAYLLVFDPSQASRQTMIDVIDNIDDIENWYAFFDNAFCVASERDARSLSSLIREEMPKQRFIITEVEPGKKGGWLPKSIWAFLKRPEPVGAAE
jgi:hypothetical protein